ncbi:MAG: hypothetical protein MZU79_04175 [Anaerotruncus sp.]|nr:hypothetical protein [Anaerotruncus sp.]
MEHGLRAFSIADHDTVAAYPEAVELGRRAGVEVIPGIEADDALRRPRVPPPPALRRLDEPGPGRDHRAPDRVPHGGDTGADREAPRLGFALTMDEVEAKSNGVPPLGVKIAQILLDESGEPGEPGPGALLPAGELALRPLHVLQGIFRRGQARLGPQEVRGPPRCPGRRPRRPGGPGPVPPRGLFPEDDGRGRPRRSRSTAWPGWRSTRSTTRPSRRPSIAALAGGARSRGHGRLGFPRPDQAPRRFRRPDRRGLRDGRTAEGEKGRRGMNWLD